MSLPEDFCIMATPETLATIGYDTLLVFGVLLDGSAIFRAAFVPPPYANASEQVYPDVAWHSAIERAFYDSMKPTMGQDYITTRIMAPASKPARPCAPIRFRRGWL